MKIFFYKKIIKSIQIFFDKIKLKNVTDYKPKKVSLPNLITILISLLRLMRCDKHLITKKTGAYKIYRLVIKSI